MTLLTHFKKHKWEYTVLLFWLLICFFVAIKDVCFSKPSADTQTVYNNYVIFKQSFFHFIKGINLYDAYPNEHYDYYKYSPTFSLFFGVFATLPNWLGLALWNSLNVFVLGTAIIKLPISTAFEKVKIPLKVLAILLLSQELYISTINEQSNALIAGMALWAYILTEKGKVWPVVFLIWGTVFIKLFGIFFFLPLLLYKNRWKYILPGLVSGVVLFLLPSIFNSTDWYKSQLVDYLALLKRDHSELIKFSVMAWLKQWFGFEPGKNGIVAVGLLIQICVLGIMLLKKHYLIPKLRLWYWLSWLIWVVIFNHMAESPTFVIAVSAVVVWFISLEKRSPWWIALMGFVLLFTSFSSSDIMPKSWQPFLLETIQLKVFPCILVYLVLVYHLVKRNGNLTQDTVDFAQNKG